MPGQAGVMGVNYTATFPKNMMADSRLIYVNPNHGDATDTGNTGEHPDQPFSTVAAALARCRDNRGDVILVGQNDGFSRGGGSDWGTAIAEEITVNVDGVSLVGLNPGPLGVYWNPITAAGAGVCITVNAMDVLIEGFTFFADTTLGGTAIHCDWDGTDTYGDNTEIRHCVFTDDVDTGISMDLPWYTHVHHCAFYQCADYGIVTTSGEQYLHIHDNDFLDVNVPTGGGGALSLGNSQYCSIHDNCIFNATARGAAPAADEGVDITGGNNMVCNNYFSCIRTDAPGNGDWGDLNSGDASSAWPANWCWNGPALATPS